MVISRVGNNTNNRPITDLMACDVKLLSLSDDARCSRKASVSCSCMLPMELKKKKGSSTSARFETFYLIS